MNQQRWQKLMARMSIGPNPDSYEDLYAAYSERHRHYHTGAHIDQCLTLFDEYKNVAPNPDDVELGIWFHDAVYKPMLKDNEAQSAGWADQFLLANKCSRERRDRIRRLIMATVHDAPATDPDAQLLVDIDLSILGADTESYSRFETNVRREYKWVPSPIYKKERRKILRSFIDRDTIYSTDALRDRYEAAARINLAAAIQAL